MSRRAEEIRRRYDQLAPWSGRGSPPDRAEINALVDELETTLAPLDAADRGALAEAEELIGRLRPRTLRP